MVELLQRLGLRTRRPPPSAPQPRVDTTGDLTQDQIAYLHELAEERRKAWLEAAREACVKQYEVNHKGDPTYRERQERWMATASTPAPTDLLRQALEQIRDGHNDPRALAREVLEAAH